MSIPVKISGSRAAAILNMSHYSTPVQEFLKIKGKEWCERNNYEYPEFEGNSSTRWGSAFESAIIELTENKLNCKINDREKFFEKDFMTCHVDGIIDNNILYEAKTTNFRNFRDQWGTPRTDEIPIIYQLQVQHNMMVANLDKCILSVLVFPKMVDEWEKMGWVVMPDLNREIYPVANFDILQWANVLDQMGYFHQYEINAHPELQQLMIEKYTKFWNDQILTDTPPEPKTYDDIKKLVREPVGTIIADEYITNLMAEYKQIKEEISDTGYMATRADMIKVEILKYMSSVEKIEDDDSANKYILRGPDGKKLASYGKNKNGVFVFR